MTGTQDNVLVLSGALDIEKWKNHGTILREISSHFPCIKLLQSSSKHNGLAFLTFATTEEAMKVCNAWQPTFFGTSTKVNIYKKGVNNMVIIKNTPTSISESEILNTVKDQYPSCTLSKRFIRNGSPLPIIQLTFDSTTDYNAILANGLVIDSIFLTTEKFIQLRQPTRCFNCNCFGHIAARCKNKTSCGKCTGDHKTSDCTSSVKKCQNCNGSHFSFDKNCQTYTDLLKKINIPFLA